MPTENKHNLKKSLRFEDLLRSLQDNSDNPSRNAYRELTRSIREQKDLDFDSLTPLLPGEFSRIDDLEYPDSKTAKPLLGRLAVCKLNGGLGTTMGLDGPKSAIEVVPGKTFMDLISDHIFHLKEETDIEVPLLLMNSFYTHTATGALIEKYAGNIDIRTFEQNKYRRLRKDTSEPLSDEDFGIEAYYPPGHGDIYRSLADQGILDELLAGGKDFLFVSNADNLGATVDLRIPAYMEKNGIDFLAESALKERRDIKGGSFVRDAEGNLRLLEIAQVPREDTKEFQNINRFRNFNTNNIWIDLRSLKQLLSKNLIRLDYLLNEKSVRHLRVLQIESTLGSAIQSFKKPHIMLVNRDRFLPVKRVDDLFLMKSNLFRFEKGKALLSRIRDYTNLPFIRLGSHYDTVTKMEEKLTWMPDLENLDFLTVSGDVEFGKNVKLSGNVIISASGGPLKIPDNSELNNQVITGHLTIDDI